MPDVSRALLRLADGLEHEGQAALSEALTFTLSQAKRLSSGMETRKDHARKDHPYARRHGQIKRPNDNVIINFQTGEFLLAWQMDGPQPDGDGLAGSVFNTDWKAGLLHAGTAKMLGRPLPEHAALDGAEELRRVLEQRLSKLF